jgi:acetate kinase
MSGAAILTLNAGSSSLKAALYAHAPGAAPTPLARGQAAGLGGETAELSLTGADGAALAAAEIGGRPDHAAALGAMIDALAAAFPEARIVAVGHRVVHGGPDFAAPARVDAETLKALEALAPFAPLHQPHNVAAIRAATARFPGATQVACFDTAFHRGRPWVSETFALPERYFAAGVRRYGFHGLSYAYLAEALRAVDPALAAGRVIFAHLGAGASLCAMRDGRPVETTMGFTALEGLAMATRPGRLDPGVLLWLMEREGMGAAEISALLYRESGLKGLSGLTGDMRALEASEDPRAAAALTYYAYRARQEIAAMAAALEGCDGVVFAGGVGERGAAMRARICEGLAWLGVTLDPARNAENAPVVSAPESRVTLRVIPTDEEAVIAAATAEAL